MLPLAKVVKKGEKPHNVRLGDKEKRGDAYGHRLLQLSYRPMSVYEPDVERSRGHCELRSNREGGDVSEACVGCGSRLGGFYHFHCTFVDTGYLMTVLVVEQEVHNRGCSDMQILWFLI